MQLWFIRHARAVDREETSLSDFQRPLTPKGRKQFAQLCGSLAKGIDLPQLLLTSPLIRAMQTAEIARREFELPASACRVDDRLSPDFGMQDLRGILSDVMVEQPNLDRLGIVGHEPSFSEVLSETIGGGAIKLSKGAVAAVEITLPSNLRGAQLKWLIVPKLLEKRD